MNDEKPNFFDQYRSAIIMAALGLLVAVLYYQTTGFQFINFDDNVYVYENGVVASGLNWASIRWAFTTFHAANWHPLTWLSLLLDSQLFGMSAGAFHAVNAVMHLVSTLLSFLVFRKLTGREWESAVIAALFAVHPTHVESVAWVAERKDVLSTIFWFLSMWLYIRWFRSGAKPNNGLFFASLGAFALGLAAKPMLVTLPFVLILCDIWPLGRIDGRVAGEYRRLFKEKIPFFALAAISSVVTVFAQRSGGATMSLESVSMLLRVENSILSYAKYLLMAVWPTDLAVLYPYNKDLAMTEVGLAAVVLIAITYFCVWQFKDRKYLLIGWLWFLGTLVPVIGLVQVGGQSMADRYTYIPYFGLFIMAVFGIVDLAAMYKLDRRIVAAVALLIVLDYSVLGYNQITYWATHESLYVRTLANTKDNYLIAQNLCMQYVSERRLDEAQRMCEASLAIRPDYSPARNSMGLIRFARQDYAGAESEFSEALRLEPGEVGFYSNLALAQVLQGKTAESEANLERASGMINPQNPPPQFVSTLRELAASHFKDKNYTKAVENFTRLLILAPSDIDSRGNLADSLFRLGRNEDALRQIQIFVSNKPNDANGRNLLGSILLTMGQRDEAAAQFEAALKINPDHSDAKTNLYRAKRGE